ncbi:MAG: 2-oxoacid:acceptor oxidoreductase subunit alpha [Anaerolineaceae bacterium]|nr:2-oxoacid:acceptor oxidoreductase subunit alpha [Anaerolineaceae bacterium]
MAKILNSTKSKAPLIVNDFCMTVCTVNGSGSATANSILFTALFNMGIPASGKNVFPSNIKGMATWFVIRANEKGFTGRRPYDDMIVAMNPATFLQDLNFLPKGGVVFYADHINIPDEVKRNDLIFYSMPIKALTDGLEVPRTIRDFTENMLYVGIVGQVLGIPEKSIRSAINKHFAAKPAIAETNFKTIKLGYDWAKKNIEKQDSYTVKELPPLTDTIMTDGNHAGALGSLFGGMQYCSWYPITPATSLVEDMNEIAPLYRQDPETGKNTFAIVQVEDELAAAGAAVGAGWAGLRSMTATSGPGLALMTETVSLSYFTETPVVFWDVQRVGPSTGLPTRTAQGDISMVYTLGHGDKKHIILIPGSVNECFEFGWKAFDLAEKYQTPVFVMSDLDLGMNTWMTKKFEYPERPINRGKIIWEKDLEKFSDWGRYMDIDKDGIPYRTVMGNQSARAAYFTRGTGHDQYGNYSENPKNWADMLFRIGRKLENVEVDLPLPFVHYGKEARIGIIGMGSTELALIEAQALLKDRGLETDFMRIRSLPCGKLERDFIINHDRTYVLELNRDGQLCGILRREFSQYAPRITSLTEIGGLPMTAVWASETILAKEHLNG